MEYTVLDCEKKKKLETISQERWTDEDSTSSLTGYIGSNDVAHSHAAGHNSNGTVVHSESESLAGRRDSSSIGHDVAGVDNGSVDNVVLENGHDSGSIESHESARDVGEGRVGRSYAGEVHVSRAVSNQEWFYSPKMVKRGVMLSAAGRSAETIVSAPAREVRLAAPRVLVRFMGGMMTWSTT